jgi:hypothetical protein
MEDVASLLPPIDVASYGRSVDIPEMRGKVASVINSDNTIVELHDIEASAVQSRADFVVVTLRGKALPGNYPVHLSKGAGRPNAYDTNVVCVPRGSQIMLASTSGMIDVMYIFNLAQAAARVRVRAASPQKGRDADRGKEALLSALNITMVPNDGGTAALCLSIALADQLIFASGLLGCEEFSQVWSAKKAGADSPKSVSVLRRFAAEHLRDDVLKHLLLSPVFMAYFLRLLMAANGDHVTTQAGGGQQQDVADARLIAAMVHEALGAVDHQPDGDVNDKLQRDAFFKGKLADLPALAELIEQRADQPQLQVLLQNVAMGLRNTAQNQSVTGSSSPAADFRGAVVHFFDLNFSNGTQPGVELLLLAQVVFANVLKYFNPGALIYDGVEALRIKMPTALVPGIPVVLLEYKGGQDSGHYELVSDIRDAKKIAQPPTARERTLATAVEAMWGTAQLATKYRTGPAGPCQSCAQGHKKESEPAQAAKQHCTVCKCEFQPRAGVIKPVTRCPDCIIKSNSAWRLQRRCMSCDEPFDAEVSGQMQCNVCHGHEVAASRKAKAAAAKSERDKAAEAKARAEDAYKAELAQVEASYKALKAKGGEKVCVEPGCINTVPSIDPSHKLCGLHLKQRQSPSAAGKLCACGHAVASSNPAHTKCRGCFNRARAAQRGQVSSSQGATASKPAAQAPVTQASHVLPDMPRVQKAFDNATTRFSPRRRRG